MKKENQYTIKIFQENKEIFSVIINCTEEEVKKLAKIIIDGEYK